MGNWKENIILINDMTKGLKNVEPDTVKHLLHLLLLFNSFEEHINAIDDYSVYYEYNGSKKRKTVRKIFLEKYNLNIDYYEETFAFFKSRYVTNGKLNKNFNGLFKNESNENINHTETRITNYLLSNNISNEKKLETCLEIAYRFRNNIFHGGKIVSEFSKFNNCYIEIIKFFENILEHSTKKYDF